VRRSARGFERGAFAATGRDRRPSSPTAFPVPAEGVERLDLVSGARHVGARRRRGRGPCLPRSSIVDTVLLDPQPLPSSPPMFKPGGAERPRETRNSTDCSTAGATDGNVLSGHELQN
jgi:hypothetical protein